MGLDPFTSTAIAEIAADETHNDPTIPAAVTAGVYGPAATSTYEGEYGQAAGQAAQASIPVVAGGISGSTAGAGGAQPIGQNTDGSFIYPSSTGSTVPANTNQGFFSSPEVGASLVSGGSQLLGTVLQQSLKGINDPRPGPVIANPAYQELMGRYLGIIDHYMQKHGIKPYVKADPAAAAPAAPSAPTAAPVNTPAAPPAPVVPSVPVAPVATSSKGQPNLQDAQLAASLGARRLGIKTDAPRLPTTRASFEQSEAEKQKQLNDTYNYIYSQRSLGV